MATKKPKKTGLKSKRTAKKAEAIQSESTALIPTPLPAGEYQLIATPILSDAIAHTDNVIEAVISSGDPEQAVRFLDAIHKTTHVVGIVLAKSLYSLSNAWETLGVSTGQTFVEFINARVGLSEDTIKQYVKVWDWHLALGENIPQEVKDALLLLPMAAQITLAKYVRESGARFSVTQLKKFIAAGTTKLIKVELDKFRTGKDAPVQKGIMFELDDGVLVGRVDGKKFELGTLSKPDEVGNNVDLADRAYSTVMKRLGISDSE